MEYIASSFYYQLIPESTRSGGEGDPISETEQLREAIDTLQHDLMKLEMHLVEQIDVSPVLVPINILSQKCVPLFRRLLKTLTGITMILLGVSKNSFRHSIKLHCSVIAWLYRAS